MFFEDKNYHYFLKLLKEKLSCISNIYSYCLLTNHFHLLVQIKSETEIRNVFSEKSETEISKIISQQFSNMFNSYTQAINKRFERTGKLFELPFRRKWITSEKQLINTILYIHNNPRKHHISENIFEYPYSSLMKIVNCKDDLLDYKEVLDIFDDEENLKSTHLNYII